MDSSSGRIRREIRQGKPFQSEAQEAVLSLVRTVDVLKVFIGELVGSHGITPQQYNVLRILRGAGETGLPTLEIRQRMVERSPGITGLLDRLEGKGFITRARGTDRRQVCCRITAEARTLLSSIEGPIAAAENAALAKLEPEELTQLIELLDRIRTGIYELGVE
jgi:DNA-binding MarR family transcriptional regulator